MILHNSLEFFQWDYANTLFPLETNRLLGTMGSEQITEFIDKQIVNGAASFQPQQEVFAAKAGLLLRRTVKLDPVAEFFIYDLVFRNRQLFDRKASDRRAVFGYKIVASTPVNGIDAYTDYKMAVAQHRDRYRHSLYLDIASYFNHIYHHDLVRWFEDIQADTADIKQFGAFFREIASGRSVDCLPHGLYATKMIGNSFLHFLDSSFRLQCAQMVRLMDDIWLFDNDAKKLVSDFQVIQQLLGSKGLSVNPKKSTFLPEYESPFPVPRESNDLEIDLLNKRRDRIRQRSYEDEELNDESNLTEFQLFWFAAIYEKYLLSTSLASNLLSKLYYHPNATVITRAKLLEIADNRYGLPDLRESYLKTGQSDWLAWASAVSSRKIPKGQRNQILKYFRKSSPMNQLIGEIVESKM